MSTWTVVLVASLGCFALKALGWAVPGRVLERERVRRGAVLVPLALLGALVVVQGFAKGQALQVDARAAGLAAAAVALMFRAPFLVVVAVAAVTAALVRQL